MLKEGSESDSPPPHLTGIFSPSAAAPPQAPHDPSPTDGSPSGDVNIVNKIPGFPNVSAAVQNVDLAQVGAKLDTLKKWSVSTFKNTKQQMMEQMGKTDRTVDTEFDAQCDSIRDLHRRYGAVVAASRQFSTLFSQLSAAEKNLAETLYQLSLKEVAVKTQCTTTGESLRALAEAAVRLDTCLKYFLSSMETLHGRTIVDTIETMNLAEQARIEFDVHRHELEFYQSSATATPTVVQNAKDLADKHKERYEVLKQDCRVKFRLLEENRIKVINAQLEKLQSALSAYFSGNAAMLQEAVRELAALAPPQTSAVAFLTD